MMKKRKEIILNIFIPIIIGTIIYILLSPNAYITKLFWGIINEGNPLSKINIMEMPIIVRWIRYYLCDILWAYALTYSIVCILWNGSVCSAVNACVVSVIFIMVVEISQITNYISGTFDYFDLIFQIVTSFFAGIIYYKKRR